MIPCRRRWPGEGRVGPLESWLRIPHTRDMTVIAHSEPATTPEPWPRRGREILGAIGLPATAVLLGYMINSFRKARTLVETREELVGPLDVSRDVAEWKDLEPALQDIASWAFLADGAFVGIGLLWTAFSIIGFGHRPGHGLAVVWTTGLIAVIATAVMFDSTIETVSTLLN